MQLLLQLIDQMRTEGYVVTTPGKFKGVNAINWSEEMPREREWELFQKVEPFVFSPGEPINQTKNDYSLAMSWKEGLDANNKIDAPFPVFSIEYLDGGPLDYFIMENGERRETMCIMVIELDPKQYGYYALCRDGGNPRKPFKVFKSNMEGETVAAMLERLNNEKMGVETTRTNVKLGTGKTKRMHRIRRIVHVSPKKEMGDYESKGLQVDWSHRWEVRGHWRTHNGLGKDREGNYSVNGFTWVVNYEKGPEHLPLVKKTRFVHGQQQATSKASKEETD